MILVQSKKLLAFTKDVVRSFISDLCGLKLRPEKRHRFLELWKNRASAITAIAKAISSFLKHYDSAWHNFLTKKEAVRKCEKSSPRPIHILQKKETMKTIAIFLPSELTNWKMLVQILQNDNFFLKYPKVWLPKRTILQQL